MRQLGRPGAGRARAGAGGLKECHAVGLEQQAGEHTGADRPGVDGDSVGVVLDRRHDGVAVHHLEAEVGGRGQERIADPDQIVAGLGIERHAGADAGVDEEVAAEADGELAGVEEGQVLGREGDGEGVAGGGREPGAGVGNAVRGERGVAAHVVGEPVVGAVVPVGIAQIGRDVAVVVAEQEPRRQVGGLERDQRLQDAAALRPAVHIVAEEDQLRPGMRPPRQIGADAGEHLGQEVEAAVHVADSVDAQALGQVGHAGDRSGLEDGRGAGGSSARAPRDGQGRGRPVTR